jgi:hypothetical protein
MANTKISDDDVRHIRRWIDEGKATIYEIADRFQVEPSYVLAIAEWKARTKVDPHLNPHRNEELKKQGSYTKRIKHLFNDRKVLRDV